MSRETVTKLKFIRDLSAKLGITRVEAQRIYETFTLTLEDALATGKPVVLGNVGRMQAYMKSPTKYRDAKTKQLAETKPIPRIKFKTATEMKNRMNQWQIF